MWYSNEMMDNIDAHCVQTHCQVGKGYYLKYFLVCNQTKQLCNLLCFPMHTVLCECYGCSMLLHSAPNLIIRVVKSLYTVEPLIMDTLKSRQPPYNGQTVHPLPIYCPYISTSEEGTTSEQWTKYSSPVPLYRCRFLWMKQVVLSSPNGVRTHTPNCYGQVLCLRTLI